MAYTEFYVQPTGSNLNAGSTADNAAPFTYAGGTFVRSTGVFTVASGNPLTDGVTVSPPMFASIYTTAGATVATCVGLITARDATTITISLTALAGATTEVSEGAGEATCKVGGAWAGPSGAVGFPFSFATEALNDGTNLYPRVNFKGGTDYTVTAGITNSSTKVVWQGYTTTVGDGGKATINGGSTGAVYTLFTSSGNNNTYRDLVWAYNGITGTATNIYGVVTTGTRSIYHQCVVYGMCAYGFFNVSVNCYYVECEAYNCNRANLAARGGFYLGSTGSVAVRCYSHDHTTGTNSSGFSVDTTVVLIGCIAAGNSGNGFYSAGDNFLTMMNCDSYGNGGDGFHSAVATSQYCVNIQNCNFVANTGWGIYMTATGRFGVIYNCGFGSGTQANGDGDITADLTPMVVAGSVTYPANTTPWTDPANGDFRITLAEAKNAGRGAFTQTDTGESARNTVGYPDIGAAFANAVVALFGFRFWTYS